MQSMESTSFFCPQGDNVIPPLSSKLAKQSSGESKTLINMSVIERWVGTCVLCFKYTVGVHSRFGHSNIYGLN